MTTRQFPSRLTEHQNSLLYTKVQQASMISVKSPVSIFRLLVNTTNQQKLSHRTISTLMTAISDDNERTEVHVVLIFFFACFSVDQ